MRGLFTWTMTRLPVLMCAAAVVVYLSSIVVGIAAGDEMRAFRMETLPISSKARAFVTLFVQPIVAPLILLFSAGILWRADQFLAGRKTGNVE